MDNVIIAHMQGGIGNQLFILVACYVIAKVHKTKTVSIALTPSYSNYHKSSKYDYYDTLLSKIPNTFKIDIPQEFVDNFHFFAKLNNIRLEFPAVKSFDEWDPSKIEIPCALEGYFQYYPPIKPYIRELTELFKTGLEAIELPFTPEENSIFLHVRRGDYVKFQDIHYLQTEDYYSLALSHFNSDQKVYIFSDDLEFCETLTILNNIPNKHFVRETDELIALALMVKCAGGSICANSTFSYWGAIMGSYYNGNKVIVPSRWCSYSPTNLFPEEWIII